MNDISSRAIDAKAFVSARLSEMEDALDGFPAAVLLDDFLALQGGDDAVDRRAQGLCEHISNCSCHTPRFDGDWQRCRERGQGVS